MFPQYFFSSSSSFSLFNMQKKWRGVEVACACHEGCRRRRRRRAAERREPIDNGITHRCLETEERNLFLPCCVTGRREKRGPISAVAAAAPPLIGRREKIQRHLIPHRSKQLKDFFFLSLSLSLCWGAM